MNKLYLLKVAHSTPFVFQVTSYNEIQSIIEKKKKKRILILSLDNLSVLVATNGKIGLCTDVISHQFSVFHDDYYAITTNFTYRQEIQTKKKDPSRWSSLK